LPLRTPQHLGHIGGSWLSASDCHKRGLSIPCLLPFFCRHFHHAVDILIAILVAISYNFIKIMKLVLMFLGKAKPKAVGNAIDEYVSRLQRLGPIEIVTVRAERIDGRAPETIKDAEGRRILEAVQTDDWLAVCDQRGESLQTDTLAKQIHSAFGGSGSFAGKRRMVIAVGGALGAAASVRERADQVWVLSGLTMAQSVARLVLVEGLYRAMTIVKGHPYHNK